jgi:8-oxo-dGTP pyrophosphatase MutT (NUDIX family)
MQFDESSVITPAYRASSVVVLDESLRILLVLEGKPNIKQGLWGTPGGGIESGELPIDAAKRELYEETGLENSQPFFLETFLNRGDRGDILMCHAFAVQIHSSTEINPVMTDEILQTLWVDKLEFDAMYASKIIRSHLTKLFVESALGAVNAFTTHLGDPA